MTSKPPWRSGFDRLERAAGAPLERLVQTRSFGKTATPSPRVPCGPADQMAPMLRRQGSLD